MPARQRWMNLEIRPAAPPKVEYSEVERAYWVSWEPVGLTVGLSEEELRMLVADAILAQAAASMTVEPS